MKNNYIIYKHTNKINGKVYIGQTKNAPNIRWQNGNGYKKQEFYKDIQKFGWDNFEHEILEQNLSSIEADERECYWIKYYNSNNENLGYNKDSGRGGKDSSTIQKMKNSWNDETRRQNQREIMIKLNKQIDRTGNKNPMYNRKRSGKDAGNKRKVQCINTKEIFETVTDASFWVCGSSKQRSHISQVCQGKRNSAGKHPETQEKLKWRYIDEYFN